MEWVTLMKALNAGAEGIQRGIGAIAKITSERDETTEGEHCKGMEGLVEEAQAHAIKDSYGKEATRDAMIITQYQWLIHYAIAGYGCLAAFAERLELNSAMMELKACLDASHDGDRTMTALATGGINREALVWL